MLCDKYSIIQKFLLSNKPFYIIYIIIYIKKKYLKPKYYKYEAILYNVKLLLFSYSFTYNINYFSFSEK